MIKAHGFVDNKLRFKDRMQHCPRVGDTVRLSETEYATVIEVVWCMDENQREGQRVNLRIKGWKSE